MAASDRTTIGDRMKENYENRFAWTLPRRIPVIIRVDGKAFHTITRRRFGKAWSAEFVDMMIETAATVMGQMQGCDICYSQSDEITFLLTDYRTINTDAWFGYDARKLISVSAALAASTFSQLYGGPSAGPVIAFDSRAFSISQDEVCNAFIWRQQDATRNAIQMAGRELYSHKELHAKSCSDIQELLFLKGVNFNDLPTARKRGFCIIRKPDSGLVVDKDIPIFSQDRDYVDKHVYVRED